MNSPTKHDPHVSDVFNAIRLLDPKGLRTAQVLRDTFDQMYDGQRTGRYRWNQLNKSELSHVGEIVEMNFHREFKFDDGQMLDYRIAGIEVSCKYSQRMGGWVIPLAALGHLSLLIFAEDNQNPTWSMGVVRVTSSCLNTGSNRDAKATLNEEGRRSITWIFNNALLPANVLLQLERNDVDRIMAFKSGQKRINELFRCALGRIVGRAVVATVAQQDDYMKRVRTNGGARTALKAEGIIILGQYLSHAAIARTLGVSVPNRGESISVRLAPSKTRGPGVAEIQGRLWKVATESDPIISAPDLPHI